MLHHDRVVCYTNGPGALDSFRLVAPVVVEAFAWRGRSQWTEIYLAHLLGRRLKAGRRRHCGVCVGGHYVLAIARQVGASCGNDRGCAMWSGVGAVQSRDAVVV